MYNWRKLYYSWWFYIATWYCCTCK